MAIEYREGELQDLRAMRDRLLQTIGWYEGVAENGGTVVGTDDVARRLLRVLNGWSELRATNERK